MALHDYRQLIDRLHTLHGQNLMIGVEITATTPPSIAMSVISDQHSLAAQLDESEAGAIFDALGGALRALAVTPHTPLDPRLAAIAGLHVEAGHERACSSCGTTWPCATRRILDSGAAA